MIATIIILVIALAWLGYETDWLRVRLESTEYQRAKLAERQAETASVKPDMPEETEPLKPLEFTPLDMPDFAGSLNIVCERG